MEYSRSTREVVIEAQQMTRDIWADSPWNSREEFEEALERFKPPQDRDEPVAR